MFDVGFWEILLILVLSLVIIGPERLPGAARQVGLFIGKARRYIEGVRSEVESELDVGEFKRMLHNQEIQINELQQQLKSGVDDVASGLANEMPDTNILTDMPSHHVDAEQAQDSDNLIPENAETTPASDDAQKSSTAKQEKS
jgi:sec-independent protein translocase protein TatB